MRVISFRAENFKRIKVVEIEPGRNLVHVAGRNAQGKSSVLDAIEAAIGGAKHIQSEPLRHGTKDGKIRLTLGEEKVELIVERKFDEAGNTNLVVTSAGGAKRSAPQDIMNSLFASIAFDPLEFARGGGAKSEESRAKYQYETLRGLAKMSVDLEELRGLNQRDFDLRAVLNKEILALKAQANAIELPDDLPPEPISTESILDEIQNAASENAKIERRREGRQQAQKMLETVDERLAAVDEKHDVEKLRIKTQVAQQTSESERQIVDIERQIDVLRERLGAFRKRIQDVEIKAEEAIERLEVEHQAERKRIEDEAANTREKLETAGPLPEPIDVSALRLKLKQAETVNVHVAARARRMQLQQRVEAKQTEANLLTLAMEMRDEDRRKAIEAAEMPIEGLGFGDGVVLYKGTVFDQASQAEQLQVSMAIAMATRPHLKVIRIKEGAFLDDDSMALVQKMAADHDFQLWIETIAPGDASTIVIEDGTVKKPAASPEAQTGTLL